MELQIFKNEQFGQVRMVEIEGQPWLVGKDVAEILGYAKPLDAISRHVDEDDSVKYGLTDNLGRTQNTIIINESGLYSLILSSKLPQAKEFKRWVTSEVLPSIRKHGMYATDQLLNDPDLAIAAFQALKAERTKNKELEVQNSKLQSELDEMKPKADYVDVMLANKGLISTTAIAKNYGESAKKFNLRLKDLGIIFKQGKVWLPYAKYHTKGYVHIEPHPITHKNGMPDVSLHTKWTVKGHFFLYEILKDNGILPLIEREDVA
jgi:prophage antirepressor-like protein